MIGRVAHDLGGSESGQKRKCPGPRGTSVLPSGADIVGLPRHVRLVLPITDILFVRLYDVSDWDAGLLAIAETIATTR